MPSKKVQNVKGTVVDKNGEPLIGVSIVEKGTTNGTVTDLDGNYTLTVQTANPVLLFSYVGYQKKKELACCRFGLECYFGR